MKTVAIKVEDDLHAQLLVIAQLESTTLTDIIRSAVEGYVANLREGDGLAAKAQAVLAEIDQETATRKQAVEALLNQLGGESSGQPAKRTRRNGGS